MDSKKITLGILIICIALSGCMFSKDTPSLQRLSQEKIDFLIISKPVNHTFPAKIAIMPFVNSTTNTVAYKTVRRTFYNHFSSKRYLDIELYDIDQILQKNKLLNNNRFLKESPSKLCRLLGVDGLVFGQVTAYDRIFLGIYSQVYVELEVTLVGYEPEKIWWKAKHKATSHEGSVPLAPVSLIPALYRTTMKIREIELIRTTEDLCRLIVSALPEPIFQLAKQ